MGFVYEQLVERYLTCNGRAFVCPQYAVAYDSSTKEGGSEPDFVVLDFDAGEVVVVEVTEAADIFGLLQKVRERTPRWFNPILSDLSTRGIVPEDQPIRFLGFVRSAVLDQAKRTFQSASDVTFMSLEEVTVAWEWWDERQVGLRGSRQGR